MAWRLDEWASLPTSIMAVMFANSVYIVALHSLLDGACDPTKPFLTLRIMVLVLDWNRPTTLLGLFLLSFTQGDVEPLRELVGASQSGRVERPPPTAYDLETMVQQWIHGHDRHLHRSHLVGFGFACGNSWTPVAVAVRSSSRIERVNAALREVGPLER